MATSATFSNFPTEHERFLFDLNGYLVLRNVFDEAEIAGMNAEVDGWKKENKVIYRENMKLKNAPTTTTERTQNENGDQTVPSPMSGLTTSAEHSRGDLGGILSAKAFRNVLTHPKLVPYFTALLGRGYRMDHQPFVILQNKDSEGFSLHGGPVGGKDHRYFVYQLKEMKRTFACLLLLR